MRTALGYRPALDGVRGAAVLIVLAGHSGWLGGGFLGVDVFFALSGFLITTLLLDEYDARGAIALSLFYGRRALRLLPALGLLLIVCTVVLLAMVPADQGPLVLQQGAVVMLYLANFSWLFGFPMGVYIHTWSLGIEEQFYLLWPLALLGMLRAGFRRGVILGVTLGAVAVGMLWRMTVAQTHEGLLRLYMSTDTHADPILIGCAAAIALRLGITRTRGAGWPSVVILGVLLARAGFPAFVYHVSTAVALLSAVIIVDVVLHPRSWLARGLSFWPLAALGRISYGVYLWHFPVFYAWGALYTPGLTMAPWPAPALAWATTLAVATVSYWALERPVLAYKATFRPTPSYAVPDPVSP